MLLKKVSLTLPRPFKMLFMVVPRKKKRTQPGQGADVDTGDFVCKYFLPDQRAEKIKEKGT